MKLMFCSESYQSKIDRIGWQRFWFCVVFVFASLAFIHFTSKKNLTDSDCFNVAHFLDILCTFLQDDKFWLKIWKRLKTIKNKWLLIASPTFMLFRSYLVNLGLKRAKKLNFYRFLVFRSSKMLKTQIFRHSWSPKGYERDYHRYIGKVTKFGLIMIIIFMSYCHFLIGVVENAVLQE